MAGDLRKAVIPAGPRAITSSYAKASQVPFDIYMINEALPVDSQSSKGLCWIRFAICVSNRHDKQDIQLIIYLWCISVTARWLTLFLQSCSLDLCFLHTHVLWSCSPQPDEPPRAAVTLTRCWQSSGAQALYTQPFQYCFFVLDFQELERKMLQSTEWVGQEMNPESGPNSAKHRFIGQICLMSPGHKL